MGWGRRLGVLRGSTGGEIRGMMWGESQFLPVYIDSLEYHSNMIADAVKKVIKVGKVSQKGCGFQGLSTPLWGT